VDVRVVSASNRDLGRATAEGRFREDLLYRLNTVTISVPPLRERADDIQPLATHFLERYSREMRKQIGGFAPDALSRLLSHTFPGNVRELQNVIEHAVVLCRGERIEVECLPGELVEGTSGHNDAGAKSAGGPLPEAEAATILQMLRAHAGHRGKTAAALGIDKTTLWRKMRKYGITYS